MFKNQITTKANMPKKRGAGQHRFFQSLLVLSFVMTLSACGNDTENTENVPRQTNNEKYNGPAPGTTDIQNFKREFWAQLNDAENCGGCHDLGGTGTTKFVRTDDVNEAYLEALTLVDVNDIPASAIVEKMANGHSCWLATDDDCANAVIGYIEAWQLAVADGSAQIQLVAPAVIKDPGNSKNFPVLATDNSPNSFEETIYPLLTDNCSACHSESAEIPQAPFFANKSTVDADAALAALESSYDAAKPKFDLDKPDISRLVVRLKEEFVLLEKELRADLLEKHLIFPQ